MTAILAALLVVAAFSCGKCDEIDYCELVQKLLCMAAGMPTEMCFPGNDMKPDLGLFEDLQTFDWGSYQVDENNWCRGRYDDIGKNCFLSCNSTAPAAPEAIRRVGCIKELYKLSLSADFKDFIAGSHGYVKPNIRIDQKNVWNHDHSALDVLPYADNMITSIHAKEL